MSSLLEQAIIDATALKEAALKNAETRILEKYSTEVRQNLKTLLEQEDEDPLGLGGEEGGDELGGDMAMGFEGEVEAPLPDEPVVQTMPDAFADGEKLCPCPDEDEEIEIDFNDLAKQLQEPEASEPGDEVDREEVFDMGVPEEEEIPMMEQFEELLAKALMEEVTFDGEVTPTGYGTGNAAEQEDAAMINNAKTLVAAAESGEVPKEIKGWNLEDITTIDSAGPEEEKESNELDILNKEKQHLAERLEITKKISREEIKNLQNENKGLKNKVSTLREKVVKVNLANAKLLYTNKALRDASLNERQKIKIVESISKACSVEEAKTIFETLQSTVSSASTRRAPNSLSEAVSRGRASTLFANRRKEESTITKDPMMAKWRTLAGLDKK